MSFSILQKRDKSMRDKIRDKSYSAEKMGITTLANFSFLQLTLSNFDFMQTFSNRLSPTDFLQPTLSNQIFSNRLSPTDFIQLF